MNLGLRRLGAGCIALVIATAGLLAVGGREGLASCQRVVIIKPEVTVGESAGTLTLTVFSMGCAAAGDVTYTVMAGTAAPGADFVLPGGQLHWTAGDMTARKITATVVDEDTRETALEDFGVALTSMSQDIHVAQGKGRGRILDDDGPQLTWVVDDKVCPEVPGKPLPVPCWECPPYYDYRPGLIDCVPTNRPLDITATLHWKTVDGTAKAGIDFVGVTDQVQTVPAGATAAHLPVQLLPREPGTPTRWFAVQIIASSQGTVVDAFAVITLGVP